MAICVIDEISYALKLYIGKQETYLQLCQTSMREHFAKIINGI